MRFHTILLFVFVLASVRLWAEQVTVHQLDVGHGICAVIEADSGARVMIDAGPSEAADAAFQYLLAHNLTTVDHLIVSHAHSDHYGGTASLVSKGVVFQNVWDNGHVTNAVWVPPEDAAAYLAAVGDRLHTMTAGWYFALGPVTTVRCLYVNGRYEDGSAFDYDGVENNASAVMKLSHDLYSHLFPADIYVDVEPHVASLCGRLDALTVAHHGLGTSTTQAFLDLTHPQVALLSIPSYPSFPAPEVVDRLEGEGCGIYLTRRGGDPRGEVRTNIVITTDGLSSFTVAPDDEYFIPEPLVTVGSFALLCLSTLRRRKWHSVGPRSERGLAPLGTQYL